MLASHLINSGYNPLLEQLAGFIKKYKQFIQSDITSDIVALTLILSTEGCATFNWPLYHLPFRLIRRCFAFSIANIETYGAPKREHFIFKRWRIQLKSQ